MANGETVVYSPASMAIPEKDLDVAPRVKSLEGKKVGLWWNSKSNGDVLLNRIGELLRQKYGNIEIIKFWETDARATNVPLELSPEVLDRMARSADVIIAATGD